MADIDPLKNIRVVLCETSHPGNIGAAARAMKTMGLSSLHLVSPKMFPDPQAERRAARAADILQNAQVHATLDEALAGVAFAVACSARTREMAVPATTAREATMSRLRLARLMMLPARRAAFTAVFSMGCIACMAGDFRRRVILPHA